jgi:predicted TPR repeat methyltransferase
MSARTPKQLFESARALHLAGNRAAAEPRYREALDLDPGHTDSLYLLGTLCAEGGRFDEALALLQRAAATAPASPMIHNNLGSIHLMRGDLAPAADCYQRALRLDPALVEAQQNLGVVLRRLGRHDEAINWLRRAIAVRPGLLEARCNLAGALLDSGQGGQARGELEAALRLNPDYPPAHEWMGRVCARLGERERAIRHLKRFLELAGPRGEASEARLLLAKLGAGELPAAYPAEVMRRTYAAKAESWDENITRPGHEFLGPGNLRAVLERMLPGAGAALQVLDAGCGTGACAAFLRPHADRLEGVDLSPQMLDQARRKGLYDALACEDLLSHLRSRPGQYDLIAASGVLILFGDLGPVLKAAAGSLRSAGLFLFTLYRGEGDRISVRDNLHFAHGRGHVEQRAREAGLKVRLFEDAIHEYHDGLPQPGFVVLLEKPPGAGGS